MYTYHQVDLRLVWVESPEQVGFIQLLGHQAKSVCFDPREILRGDHETLIIVGVSTQIYKRWGRGSQG